MTADHFAESLLAWYDQHGRHNLPWHHNRNAYRVWVSEIMLQQTQVATVIPYYQAFMERFPDVRSLAEAPVDDVLSHWSGLGYYARARNLQKAALSVMEDFGGQFPSTQEELETLIGIGRSTAAAIIAQTLNKRAAILDGNVKRVLARYHAVPGWPGQASVLKQLWEHAEAHTPNERVRDYTQGIMDLGAIVCTRSRPACSDCPLQQGCAAYAQNETNLYPGSKPKKAKPEKTTWMIILEDNEGRILLERRPPSGIWGGLWSLPELDPAYGADELQEACEQNLGFDCGEPELISGFRHTFSHYHLHIQPVRLGVSGQNNIKDNDQHKWLYRHEALSLGLPAPIRTLLTAPEQSVLLRYQSAHTLELHYLVSSGYSHTHLIKTGANMSRTVFCRKHQKELDGLDFPPMPGAKGQDIFENISKQAWEEWQHEQTMLINEKHLSLMDPNTRKYLQAQMEHYFNNEPFDKAEGYVPPEK